MTPDIEVIWERHSQLVETIEAGSVGNVAVMKQTDFNRALTDFRADLPRTEVDKIPAQGSLDDIVIYWEDYSKGHGMVTLVCYGSAWNAYFAAMGKQTIQEFFASADTDYLVNKLGNTVHLYQRKKDLAYLGRIVNAVKAFLTETEQ